LNLCRNVFALSMCLTKFLLNAIQTLCTDMEVTILCCNLTPFLHIIATCLLIHLSQSAGIVVATRYRAEKSWEILNIATQALVVLLPGVIVALYNTGLAPCWSLCWNTKNLSSLYIWASCNILDLCVGGGGLNLNYCCVAWGFLFLFPWVNFELVHCNRS